jgi:hypothetical protein
MTAREAAPETEQSVAAEALRDVMEGRCSTRRNPSVGDTVQVTVIRDGEGVTCL